MAKVAIDGLEGGKELCQWFGGEPSFHDARLTELKIMQGKPSSLVAETFHMGSETDDKGYFVLTKHVKVTFSIIDLIACQLEDCMEASIIFDLEIDRSDDGVTVSFSSSYGAHGWVKGKSVSISFEPKP